MKRFVIYLPEMPPTVNTAYATVGKRRVLTKAQRDFRKVVNQVVTQQMPDDWKYCTTKVILTPSNYRVFDVDNRLKPSLDALTASRFWRDDSQVAKTETFATYPAGDDGCILVVEKAESKYFDMRDVAPLLDDAVVMDFR